MRLVEGGEEGVGGDVAGGGCEEEGGEVATVRDCGGLVFGEGRGRGGVPKPIHQSLRRSAE